MRITIYEKKIKKVVDIHQQILYTGSIEEGKMAKSNDNTLAAWSDIILGKLTKCIKCGRTSNHRAYEGPVPKCTCGGTMKYVEGVKSE